MACKFWIRLGNIGIRAEDGHSSLSCLPSEEGVEKGHPMPVSGFEHNDFGRDSFHGEFSTKQ